MPNLTADRVKETTTTTGTGTVTLAGAVAQFRSFASAFADGNVVQYAIIGQTGTEWEVGNGTLGASGTTLARTTVLASSNAGAAVNFSVGTKDVFATITAAHLLASILGPASATDNAVARFDATTGKLLKNSPVTISNNGLVAITRSGGETVSAQDNAGVWFLESTGLRLAASCTVNWGGSRDIGALSATVMKIGDGGAGIRAIFGGGAAVASAAALPVPTGRVFHVTGTTNITSITSTNFQAGVAITMIFDGVLTVTDGGNLKLAGNFVTAADSTLSLVFDGTNWFETSRSAN